MIGRLNRISSVSKQVSVTNTCRKLQQNATPVSGGGGAKLKKYPLCKRKSCEARRKDDGISVIIFCPRIGLRGSSSSSSSNKAEAARLQQRPPDATKIK